MHGPDSAGRDLRCGLLLGHGDRSRRPGGDRRAGRGSAFRTTPKRASVSRSRRTKPGRFPKADSAADRLADERRIETPATITLTAAPNDDLERSGELTVYAGAHVQRVTVTQDAFPIVPTLTLDGLTDDTLEFEFSDLDPVTFSVYANVAWTALPEKLDGPSIAALGRTQKRGRRSP